MDFIGYLRRIMNKDASETFAQSTDSLEAIRDYIASVLVDIQGLAYYGVVTAVPGANQFTINGLAGYGETAFVNWPAFVFWDAGGAGAAPQGEIQIITAYTDAGVFTTPAFSAAVGVGDKIFIINREVIKAILATTGTFSHPSGVAEQTAFTITLTRPTEIKSIFLDLVNLTQNATIRIKHQIDGTNYRTIETFNWTTGMDDGVFFRSISCNDNVQVSIQSTVAEGAARDIPYEYALEE